MTTRAKKVGNGRAVDPAEFVSALGDVDQLTQLLKRKPIDAKTLIALVAHLVAAETTKRQKFAANKKHEKTQTAKKFTIDFWHKKRCQYRFNKDFSIAAAAVVLQKYGVSVKAETIARDWLRGVPVSRSMTVKKGARAYVDGEYIGGSA